MTTDWTRILTESIRQHGVPGAALGLYRQGRTRIVTAGVRNLVTRAPVTIQTVFRLASMSKLFTALLAMRLVEQGRVALDEPLIRVWPGLRLADAQARETLTLRHLLSHRAGFYGDVFEDLGDDTHCLERYADGAGQLDQITAPGAAFSYSNAAFVLAGRLTEILTGSVWDELFRDEITGPLGMTRTGVLWRDLPDDVAASHLPGDDGELAPVLGERELRTMGPAGATPWTTAADALALGRMLMAGGDGGGRRIASSETIRAMTALSTDGPTRTFAQGWGLGVQRFDRDGRVFGHDGAVGGQLSFLRIAPEHDLVLALFTNGGDGRGLLQALWDHLAQHWPEPLIEPPPAWPESTSTIDLARLVGRYGVKRVRIDVEPGDGDLIASFRALDGSSPPPAPLIMPMRPEPGDRTGELFVTLTAPARLPLQQRFTLPPSGGASHLLFRGRLYPRIEPA